MSGPDVVDSNRTRPAHWFNKDMHSTHAPGYAQPCSRFVSQRSRGNRATNRAQRLHHDQKFRQARLSPRRLFLRGASPRAAKKNAFSRQNFRSRDPDILLRKKLVGRCLHGILMKVHARTRSVAVADLEKMLAKVQGILGDVDS